MNVQLVHDLDGAGFEPLPQNVVITNKQYPLCLV
jgi:hypothetical protein